MVNYNSDITRLRDFVRISSPLILPIFINHLHLKGFTGLKNLLPASGDTVKFQYWSIFIFICCHFSLNNKYGQIDNVNTQKYKEGMKPKKHKQTLIRNMRKLIIVESFEYPYQAVNLDKNLPFLIL